MEKLNNIKIIFIDIDGTLTNSNNKITESTKKSIKKIIDENIKVIITTGRNYFYASNKSKNANASNIVISSDGSVIYDYKENKTLYKNNIDNNKVKKLYNYANDNNLGILINSNHSSYCNKFVKEKEKYSAKIVSYNEIENIEVCQIVIMSNKKNQIEKIKNIINKLNLKISYFSKSFKANNVQKDYSIDIVNNNVSKGESVKYLLKKLKIEKEQSLCIGDYDNDLEMFKACGFRVAMKNSTEKVKKEADFITLSNDEDGVAYFLNKYL